MLNEIMIKTNDVNKLMDEIAAASDEQSKGTAQVTTAINQMETVVQSNAATAEESAASAEELQNQAIALSGVVGELTALVKGVQSVNSTQSQSTIPQARAPRLTTPRNKQIVTPNDVIPLDDDEF